MRKAFTFSVILLLFISWSGGVSGQSNYFEYAFEPSLSSEITNLISDGAGNYYACITNSLLGIPGGGIRVVKLNSSGEIVHSSEFPFNDMNYSYAMDWTYDGHILVAGYWESCDVFYNAGELLELDTSGTLIWQKDISPTYSDPLDNRIRHVIGLENGYIIAACETTLVICDSYGDSLSGIFTPFSIVNLCKTGNGDFIIETTNDISKYDVNGNLLQILAPSPNPTGLTYFGANRYVGYVSNSIVVTDSLLNIAYQYSLSQLTFNTDYFTIDANRILLSSHTGNGFALFDSTLNLIDSFSVGLSALSFVPSVISGDTIVSGGKDIGYKNYPFLKSFGVSGQYLPTNTDLELVAVNFDTTYAYNVPWQPSFIYNIAMVPKVLVQNNGTDTIRNFNLNYESFMPGMCGPGSQIISVDSIQLLPGQSMEVLTDTLFEGALNLSVFPFVFPVCAWVSIPNNFQDSNHSNDYHCDTAYIYPINGISEITEGSFRLYPNPATGTVQIIRSSGRIAKEYFIEDISARIITSGKIENESIDLSTLTSGIYFIHFNDESFRYKVVKQ